MHLKRPKGSKDGKLNPEQFAAMQARKNQPREKVRYRESRKYKTQALEAAVETILGKLAEEPDPNAMPRGATTSHVLYGPCQFSCDQALSVTAFF